VQGLGEAAGGLENLRYEYSDMIQAQFAPIADAINTTLVRPRRAKAKIA